MSQPVRMNAMSPGSRWGPHASRSAWVIASSAPHPTSRHTAGPLTLSRSISSMPCPPGMKWHGAIDMRAGVNGRRNAGDVHTAVFMTNAAFDADRREELLREHAVAVRLRKVNQSHGAHLRKVERQALPPR